MKRFFSKIIIPCAVVVIIVLYLFNSTEESIETIKKYNIKTSDELANNLIKELYSGVIFKPADGIPMAASKKLYCSNLYIDCSKEGQVKILSDVKANDFNDPIAQWLFNNEPLNVTNESVINGIIYREAEAGSANIRMLINPENNRIFAAVIDINYNN